MYIDVMGIANSYYSKVELSHYPIIPWFWFPAIMFEIIKWEYFLTVAATYSA